MWKKFSTFLAVVIAGALTLATGGSLLAIAEGSAPVGGGSAPVADDSAPTDDGGSTDGSSSTDGGDGGDGSDGDASTGGSAPTPTVACEVVNGACTYMLAGNVYFDYDGNGVQDAGDTDISGVDVHLYMGATAAGTPIQSTTTASPFVFDQLAPGTYTVLVDQDDLPEGCEPTNDFDGGTWGMAIVTLTASGEIDVDFGCTPIVSGNLAFTGGSQGSLALFGAIFMVVGTGATLMRRRAGITVLV